MKDLEAPFKPGIARSDKSDGTGLKDSVDCFDPVHIQPES
jgi:hypothetical protein